MPPASVISCWPERPPTETMRVLDRYLIRELFVPILICSITLVFLVLIADLFDNLDSLLKNQTPLWFVFRYYLMLTPYAFTQTVP